jgi:hypothetical protein
VDGDSLAVDSTAVEAAALPTIQTDSIGVVQEDSMASVTISAEWPTGGNEKLVAAIRQHIWKELDAATVSEQKQMGVKYSDDGKEVVKSAVTKHYDELSDMWKGMRADGLPWDMAFYFYARIWKTSEGKGYVTYTTNTEGFTGGAHGYATSTAVTFSKSSGEKIGYDNVYDQKREKFVTHNQTLFKDTTSPKLYQLIKESLRKCMAEENGKLPSDAELNDMLQVDDINRVPLPQFAPCFTDKGLCFTYQQYEIACYAVGIISFDIPYDEIRPYLTPQAAALAE